MEGIIINSLPYKEKSKIVHLYTPSGIKSLIVRDASKFYAATTTLNVLDVEVSSRSDFPYLKDFSVLASYYDLNSNLSKVEVAIVIIKVLNSLETNSPHQRIYPFVLQCLEALKTYDSKYVLTTFLVKMTPVFGIKPHFVSCVICKSKEVFGFNCQAGGAICSTCLRPLGSTCLRPLDLNIFETKFLAAIYEEKIFKAKDFDYQKLLRTLFSYYEWHTDLVLPKKLDF